MEGYIYIFTFSAKNKLRLYYLPFAPNMNIVCIIWQEVYQRVDSPEYILLLILRKFYGKHYDQVIKYNISVSAMTDSAFV